MDSVVKMKSLPFDATQLDIIQFFEQYKLKPNGVQLVVRSDNKPTGEVCASLACAGSSCVCAWQQFSGMPSCSSRALLHPRDVSATAICSMKGWA
jgi:hypothetical protein